jgi:hypothetical protein
LRKLTIAAVIAVIASLAFTGVASAHTLRYKTARSLAVRLGDQEEREDHVDRWRIFGAERINAHEIVWVYNVDYADGTLCDAELVVKMFKTRIKAFFRDRHCEPPS